MNTQLTESQALAKAINDFNSDIRRYKALHDAIAGSVYVIRLDGVYMDVKLDPFGLPGSAKWGRVDLVSRFTQSQAERFAPMIRNSKKFGEAVHLKDALQEVIKSIRKARDSMMQIIEEQGYEL